MTETLPACLIAGAVEAPEGKAVGVIDDPNTGAHRFELFASSPGQAERALVAADALHASGIWADATPEERGEQLRPLASLLTERAADLARADSVDSGVLESFLAMILPSVAAGLGGLAEIAEAIGVRTTHDGYLGPVDQHRIPWGPALILSPFNGPLVISLVKATMALAAGCPVIIKPSERTPTGASLLAQVVADAGVPQGLIQVLHGGAEVGSALVTDRRVACVSYTGGTAGGIAVARSCAEQLKPADLELSGNGPVVVAGDADIDLTASEIVAGMTKLNGQWCAAPRRVIAHRSILAHLQQQLVERLHAMVIGSSLDPRSTLGPMVDRAHRDLIERQLAGLGLHGATVERTGALPDGKGSFVLPAVVTGADRALLREEIFGPVISLQPFEGRSEAVALANDAPQGLVAYAFAADDDWARDVGRRLRAGQTRINGASLLGPSAVGHGSMWGNSGLGETGPAAASFFTGGRFVGPAMSHQTSPI